MIKRAAIALFCLMPTTGWTAEPFARATVEDDRRIVPGQQVIVDVDVFVPDFFTSPPQFPVFEIPRALVTLAESRSENITQTIDGVQYSGIRRPYAIVPQASGSFTLPELNIDLGYSVNGRPTKSTVTMPSVSFDVTAPSDGERGVAFAASKLKLEQSFDPSPQSLEVGDALVRTITVTAEETQAMMFPPVGVGTVAGLQQYSKQPKIEDRIAVGRNTASRRTETYVYTADREGTFALPSVSYNWFDIESHEPKSASLPAIRIAVSPAISGTAIKPVLEEAPRQPPHVARQKIAFGILLLMAAAALVWLARRFAPALTRYVREIVQHRRASYGYRLKLLRKRILSGSEMEIYSALHNWSRTLGYRTLDDWVRDGPEDLKPQVDIISRRLFRSGEGAIDRRKLVADVDFRRSTQMRKVSALPPLNPPRPGVGVTGRLLQ